jgi:hypothetical protein
LKDIRAWQNDKVTVFLPPHRDDVRALLDEERAHFDSGSLIWPEDETRRYFIAGGGEATVFNGLWERARRAWSTRLSMSHAANEGGLFYVVTGKKK